MRSEAMNGRAPWTRALVLAALATGAWLCFAPACAVAGGEVTDAIVLTVGWQTVSHSALVGYQRCFAEDCGLSAALTQLMGDMLLAEEAKRYGFTVGERPLPVPASRYGLSEQEWRAFAAMRQLAGAFMTFRLQTQVQVDALAVKAYFEQSPQRWPDAKNWDDPTVIADFQRTQRNRLTDDYIKELRARSDVRIRLDGQGAIMGGQGGKSDESN